MKRRYQPTATGMKTHSKNKTLVKVHDFVGFLIAVCWINWMIYGIVTGLVFKQYQPDPSLSQPQKGIYIASRNSKTIAISKKRYKYQYLYWFITWTLWWGSWPLVAVSHFLGKHLDKIEPPMSKKKFLERAEKEAF